MQPPIVPPIVYHGTDAVSADSIERMGLDTQAWNDAGGIGGADPKGFSVTTKRSTAESWAAIRAGERGASKGVVLEAETKDLPLQPGSPGLWTDPDEFFIQPRDFPQVGLGTFRRIAEVIPIP
jgi:hypothetical protein